MIEFPEGRDAEICLEQQPVSGSLPTYQETEYAQVQHQGQSLHQADSSTLLRKSPVSPRETHCESLGSYYDSVNSNDKTGITYASEKIDATHPTPSKMVGLCKEPSMAAAGCVELNWDGAVYLSESSGGVLPCS